MIGSSNHSKGDWSGGQPVTLTHYEYLDHASLLHTAIDAPQLVWMPLFLDVGTSNSSTGEMGLNQ